MNKEDKNEQEVNKPQSPPKDPADLGADQVIPPEPPANDKNPPNQNPDIFYQYIKKATSSFNDNFRKFDKWIGGFLGFENKDEK